MKKYILLAAVVITLTACNTEDNYIDEPVAAQISATIGETLSRASDNTWGKGDNIGISMSGRYINMKYSTEDGDGTFAGSIMYFRNKVEPVTLTAYYPYTGTEGESPAIIEASTGAGRQTSTEQSQFDFLYAVKENVTGAEPNVNLAFSHMMSKLTLIFKNGNDGTDVSKITSYTIEGLALDGTFDPATGVCVSKDIASQPLAIDLSGTTVISEKEIPSLIVFPQKPGTNNTLKMKIHDSEGQDYACELNFGTNGLVSGNNYQFTITVNKTLLAVHPSINKWQTETFGSEAKSDD